MQALDIAAACTAPSPAPPARASSRTCARPPFALGSGCACAWSPVRDGATNVMPPNIIGGAPGGGDVGGDDDGGGSGGGTGGVAGGGGEPRTVAPPKTDKTARPLN